MATYFRGILDLDLRVWRKSGSDIRKLKLDPTKYPNGQQMRKKYRDEKREKKEKKRILYHSVNSRISM